MVLDKEKPSAGPTTEGETNFGPRRGSGTGFPSCVSGFDSPAVHLLSGGDWSNAGLVIHALWGSIPQPSTYLGYEGSDAGLLPTCRGVRFSGSPIVNRLSHSY